MHPFLPRLFALNTAESAPSLRFPSQNLLVGLGVNKASHRWSSALRGFFGGILTLGRTRQTVVWLVSLTPILPLPAPFTSSVSYYFWILSASDTASCQSPSVQHCQNLPFSSSCFDEDLNKKLGEASPEIASSICESETYCGSFNNSVFVFICQSQLEFWKHLGTQPCSGPGRVWLTGKCYPLSWLGQGVTDSASVATFWLTAFVCVCVCVSRRHKNCLPQ